MIVQKIQRKVGRGCTIGIAAREGEPYQIRERIKTIPIQTLTYPLIVQLSDDPHHMLDHAMNEHIESYKVETPSDSQTSEPFKGNKEKRTGLSLYLDKMSLKRPREDAEEEFNRKKNKMKEKESPNGKTITGTGK